MIIGYAAIDPNSPNPKAGEPHTALIAAGAQRLFVDVMMANTPRNQLDAAIDAISQNDVLVAASVETLTRSAGELISIASRLDAKGAFLLVLQVANCMPLDTRTTEGRAMLGALAIFRTLDAPALSQPAPVARDIRPRGRPATACAQSGEVARMHQEGIRATDIAARLGIGRASVYRILSQGGTPQPAQADPTETSRASALARRLNIGHS